MKTFWPANERRGARTMLDYVLLYAVVPATAAIIVHIITKRRRRP